MKSTRRGQAGTYTFPPATTSPDLRLPANDQAAAHGASIKYNSSMLRTLSPELCMYQFAPITESEIIQQIRALSRAHSPTVRQMAAMAQTIRNTFDQAGSSKPPRIVHRYRV